MDASTVAIGSGGIQGRPRRAGKLVTGILTSMVLSASLLVQTGPASAVVPGANGRIACEGGRVLPGETTTNPEVFTINPDGSEEMVLTDFPGRDGDPSWSPDGRTIAFESFRSGFSEVWTMNSDGTGLTQLTFNGAPEDRGTSWSPDGSRIAYHTTEFPAGEGHSRFEIMTMNADGTDKVRLTENLFQDSLPSWSPDGTQIAFNSFRDGDHEIYVMNADGTNPTRLTFSPGEDAHPMWSPDGSQITFHTRRFGNLDVMVMDADGSNPRLVTTNTEETHEFFPVWSPDGTQITFTGNTVNTENFDVYVINVDGTGVTQVTFGPGFNGRCDWGRLPPAIVTIDGTVLSNGTRGRVTGTVTCEAGNVFLLQLRLTQGGTSAEGRTRGTCSGSPQTFGIGFIASGGSFSDGSAEACVAASTALAGSRSFTSAGEVCEEVTIDI